MATSKYGAKRTEYDGRVYASRAEARRAADLTLLQMAGEIRALAFQQPYPLEVNGVKVGTYVADFTYWTKEGRFVVEDVKGVATPVFRLKKKLVKAIHGIEIVEVAA